MSDLYKLKHTLYPTNDDDLTTDKEEWDEQKYPIYRKGTIWKIASKEEYCKLQNYDEEETECFMRDGCDFEVVAYMKSIPKRYILLNTLEYFELQLEESEK